LIEELNAGGIVSATFSRDEGVPELSIISRVYTSR
jgi:hypothetical protein